MADIKAHVIKQSDRPQDRRHDIIHPSEMANHYWCPRSTFYRIRDVRLGKTIKPEQHAIGTLSIFEEGHYIHDKYQTWLRQMGRIKGRWDCVECDRKGVAWPDDPGLCPFCGSVAGIKYAEVPLDAEKEHLICGRADGWVDGLIEIKSIGKGTVRLDAPKLYEQHTVETVDGRKIVDVDGLWDGITRPLPAHVKQANIYLYLAKLMGIPCEPYMEFLYEFKPNQQMKSFKVSASPAVIDPLIEKADTVKIGLETETPPPREYFRQDKKPCSSCYWKEECWGSPDSSHQKSAPSQAGRSSSSEGGSGHDRAVRSRSAGREAEPDSPRPDRPFRPRVDGALHRADRLGELPRNAPGESTDRGEIRRVRAGNPAGIGGPREGFENGDGEQGHRARRRRSTRS